MFKRAMAALAVFILIVAGAVMYLSGNADPIARHGVEKALAQALGVPVAVGDAQVDKNKATVLLHDIEVDNPPGYPPGKAVVIKSADVKFDLSSFLSERHKIASIHINGCEMNEQPKDGTTNIEELKEHARRIAGMGGASPENQWVEIEELKIDGLTLNESFEKLGGRAISFAQEPIEMHNIGSQTASAPSAPKEQKVSIADAVGTIFDKTLAQARDLSSAQLPAKLAALKGEAAEAAKKAGATAESLRKQLGAKTQSGAAELKAGAQKYGAEAENKASEAAAAIKAKAGEMNGGTVQTR